MTRHSRLRRYGFGMLARRDVLAPLGLGGRFRRFDHRGVLTMRGDEGRGVTEDALQRGFLVDEHIARWMSP